MMKKLTYGCLAVFGASALILGASLPAQAEGGCSYGHSLKTAQSSQQEVAQTPPLQTPKPSGS